MANLDGNDVVLCHPLQSRQLRFDATLTPHSSLTHARGAEHAVNHGGRAHHQHRCAEVMQAMLPNVPRMP